MLDYLRFRGAFCDLRTAPHIGDLARVEELVDQDPSMVSRPSDYVTYYACAGTALRNAAAAGHREVVPQAGQFIDHGADVLARDEDICLTPLGWAAKFGRTATVRYLLQRGALPQLPDEPPWATPLAWAQRRNHPDIVHCLREAGNP
jgi:ankyrin repeat protein